MVWDKPVNLHARQPAAFTFSLFDPSGNVPSDMVPYMGMAGHAAFVKTDGAVFAHLHPSGTASMAATMMAASENGPAAQEMQAEPVTNTVSFPYGFPKCRQLSPFHTDETRGDRRDRRLRYLSRALESTFPHIAPKLTNPLVARLILCAADSPHRETPMPPKRSITLTEAELRLMKILWDRGESAVSEMVAAIPDHAPLAYNSVLDHNPHSRAKRLRPAPSGWPRPHLPRLYRGSRGEPFGDAPHHAPLLRRLTRAAAAFLAGRRRDPSGRTAAAEVSHLSRGRRRTGGGVMHSSLSLQEVAAIAGGLLLASIWQGMVLAGVIALGLRLMPRANASARFAVWMGAFLTLAALPVLRLAFLHASGVAGGALKTRPSLLRLDSRWSFVLLALWGAFSLVRTLKLGVGAVRVRGLWEACNSCQFGRFGHSGRGSRRSAVYFD